MASAEVTGERVGRYTLLFRIATGGMGEVFVAVLRGSGDFTNVVVLKRLLPGFAEDPRFVASLREEARLAAQVRHPNVCQVFELVEEPTVGLALVMEYLEGVPMRRLASPTIDLGVATGLFVQACAGLERIHDLTDRNGRAMGLVHRDVNPSNLFVTVDGTLKVLDFGIAKAEGAPKTRAGTIKGTSDFLAPEQILGHAVDRRVDVFGLGASLFELVTGRSPFRRDTEYQTFRAITEEPAPRARDHRGDLPAELDDVIARALARAPADRFPTVAAMAEAITGITAAPPLLGRAIAAHVAGRFQLELEERRRRIARGLEDLAQGAEAAPTTTPLGPSEEATAPGSGARTVAASPRSRSRGRRPILIAGAVALAASVALAVTRPWDRGETAVVAAATPAVDAARARPSLPPDAPPPVVDAAAVPVPTPSPAPTPRTKPPRRPPHSAAPGFVTIASRPFAVIELDGKQVGTTPLYRTPVAPGKHRVRAKCSCGKVKTFTIDVVSGVAAPARTLTW